MVRHFGIKHQQASPIQPDKHGDDPQDRQIGTRWAQTESPSSERRLASSQQMPTTTGITTVSSRFQLDCSNWAVLIAWEECAAMPNTIGTATGDSKVAVVVRLTE